MSDPTPNPDPAPHDNPLASFVQTVGGAISDGASFLGRHTAATLHSAAAGIETLLPEAEADAEKLASDILAKQLPAIKAQILAAIEAEKPRLAADATAALAVALAAILPAAVSVQAPAVKAAVDSVVGAVTAIVEQQLNPSTGG